MGKVLIIEDDPYVQRMYNRMFSFKPQYQLLLASNGEAGITFAKKEKPDIVLLDIMLPGMNGLQVLKKLKDDPETKNIPVLMLTNLGEESVMDEAKRLGADSYMVKADFSPDQVLMEVDKRLEKSTEAHQS